MAILIDQLTLGELKILAIDSDPRTGGGYAAEIGSYATINNQGSPVGQFYLKVGAGNTDWNLLATEESNGTVQSGVARRLALYPQTDNLVDDVLVENSQDVTVDIVAQPTRTAPINYQVPNPGDAVTAADFVLTEGIQTINGDKTFGDDVTIQGDLTVNGTLTSINTVNTTITDKLITLNKNGAAASGSGVGFEIEEDALITGYFKTDSTRLMMLMKVPAGFEAALDLTALSADRAVQFQDRSGYMALQTPAALTQGSVMFVDAGLKLEQDNANFFWDDSNNRLGIGTPSPADTLHVAGNVRVSGSGSTVRLLAESDFTISQATVATTDATATTAATVAVPTNSSMLLEVRVVGRRTGGSSGAAGDAAHYIRTARLKNVAGTVTLHNLQSDYTSEDQTGWNGTITVTGTNALVRVTGAANNNITWEVTVLKMIVD